MDFAKQFDFSDSSFLELVSPTDGKLIFGDDGETVKIELYSADSDIFQQLMRDFGNKKLNAKVKRQTVEEFQENSLRILARATKNWSDNFEVAGEKLECNFENAKMLYSEYPWIREQVDSFVNERANFLKQA